MNAVLIDRIVKILSPSGVLTRQEVERRYPTRILPKDAEVMRMCPSPTGFMHIGSLYAGLINTLIARQSGGVSILRIEDTDKKREVPGAFELIFDSFAEFDVVYDESSTAGGAYGPYRQSERAELYMAYAIELLSNGRAYPCFASPEELSAAVKDQQTRKVRPGYYGQWALWRDRRDEDVVAALDADTPFVLRFRSEGTNDKRVEFEDVLKGRMNIPENDLDVPLIKSDEWHLPTYHLAHVVDDSLMGATMIFRGEEWLPSTALHIELCHALGIPQFRYAHFGLISIIDVNSGGKRKLSKRKDPEADVAYWAKAGYPKEGVKAYLLGLANSNFEDWYNANPGVPVSDFPISLQKLAQSRSPLLDTKKLDDYCKNFLGDLSQIDFETEAIAWGTKYDPQLVEIISKDIDYTSRILSIERDGDQKRKDLAKWSDLRENYGYFYDELYASDFANRIKNELKDLDSSATKSICASFLATYDPADDQPKWFEKLKKVAAENNFATDMKVYKADPTLFKGSLADVAKIIRVTLTGKNRTPDLYAVMKVMGHGRVSDRLRVR